MLALHWLTLASLFVIAIVMYFRKPIVRLLGDRDAFRELLITMVSIVLTAMFATAISESETRAKYVELGVDILRSEPRKKADDETAGESCDKKLSIDEEALRTWAYELVDTYSDVRMKDRTKTALICKGLKIIIGTGDLPHCLRKLRLFGWLRLDMGFQLNEGDVRAQGSVTPKQILAAAIEASTPRQDS